MRHLFLLSSIISLLFLISCENNLPEEEPKEYPSDYMFQQRAFPGGYINRDAYKAALTQTAEMRRSQVQSRDTENWEPAGPTNVGGRISALAADASGQTIYAGVASGGVWKTTDDGLNWESIFDEAPTLSIGDLAVAQSDEQTIYVGTGESNAGGGSLAYDGYGVFKTTNGGEDWQSIGLVDAGSIGKVLIHPTDPNTVYVAAMGYLFADNDQRGVYRTEDGGLSWEKVLFVNDSTGAIDLSMHPTHPDIVYAATWERIRRPHRRQYGGPGSAIWRTVDSGDTWEKLAGGLPPSDNGRIGLAVTPDEPDMVLALIEGSDGFSKGVYRSYDMGDTWAAPPGDQGISYPGYGWWFGKIFIDPTNKDKVFALGVNTHLSTDGALNFTDIQTDDVHVDQHALYIDPSDPNRVILGNDGGVYVSNNGGTFWEFRSNIPITQFYTCEIDFLNPERFYGGTQDNGTWRTYSGAIDEYERLTGGDGFHASVNPIDPNFILTEFQYGGLMYSENGGADFAYRGNQIEGRKNWNMPIVRDPNNPNIVYAGSESLYRSTNNGFDWSPISPDLTNGESPNSNLLYASITSISLSSLNSDIIWVGTDDGNVQVSHNGSWTKVSGNLPVRWVTRVVADPHDEQTAYVTYSGYRYHDYLSHVFKTTDLGQNWTDISGNLPEAPANDLIVDPEDPQRLYLATDVGTFITFDGGANWEALGAGMPIVPVTDLEHHSEEFFLLAATYGRSFYKIDTREPLSTGSPISEKATLSVFPNPIHNDGQIKIQLEAKQKLHIAIYNMQGQMVLPIYNGHLTQGMHQFDFDRTQLPVAGKYFVRAFGEGIQEVEKVVLH